MKYKLRGTYGYICPMVFDSTLTKDIFIEPNDDYESFIKELELELGLEDVSNIPVYLPYCDIHTWEGDTRKLPCVRTGSMSGTFENPKLAFDALERFKTMETVKVIPDSICE